MHGWMYLGGYDPVAASVAPLRFERFSELCQPKLWGTVVKRPWSAV
jgi:hypothetical protein